MDKPNDCYIYEDLMTLQPEGLLQPETSRALQEHLQRCPACRQQFERLTKELPRVAEPDSDSIDYLKTIRRQQLKKTLMIVGGFLIIVLSYIALKLFIIGTPNGAYQADYTYHPQAGGSWQITGRLMGSGEIFTRYEVLETDDERIVQPRVGVASVFHRRDSFELQLPADKIILVKGERLYPGGVIVSERAIDLFDSRTPYIGNNSEVIQLLHRLRVGLITPFSVELATDQLPYGLTILAEGEFSDGDEPTAQFKTMSELILSLIDNCDYVTWEYEQAGHKSLSFYRDDPELVINQIAYDPLADVRNFQKLLHELDYHY